MLVFYKYEVLKSQLRNFVFHISLPLYFPMHFPLSPSPSVSLSVILSLSLSLSPYLACSKVYLAIDGGRFYSFESVGSRLQRMYVQTTILGEYYFDEYLQMHPQYRTKPPQPILPSIYCQPVAKRPYFTLSDIQGTVESGGDSMENLTVKLSTKGHLIDVPTSAILNETKTSNIMVRIVNKLWAIEKDCAGLWSCNSI